jgi:hypothetical protein
VLEEGVCDAVANPFASTSNNGNLIREVRGIIKAELVGSELLRSITTEILCNSVLNNVNIETNEDAWRFQTLIASIVGCAVEYLRTDLGVLEFDLDLKSLSCLFDAEEFV